MATKIETPYPIFEDVDGQPLEDGYLYIGTAGLDPVTNPITVYSDASLSTAVTQPVRTTAGYPVVSGSPIRLYTGATDFSLQVNNKNTSQIHQNLNAGAAQREFSNVVEGSSGNVGVGTDNPAAPLQVHATSGHILITNPTTGTSSSDGLTIDMDGVDARLINRENGIMAFYTNNTERMRILAAGGLAFNGDTAAANALNDYEEGTWTPAFTNIGTGTYAVQVGGYTKIGDTVFASCKVELATLGSASGNVKIQGLPFTSSSTANLFGGSSSIFITSMASGQDNMVAYVDNNATESSIFHRATTSISNLTHAELGGTGNIIVTFIYKAA